MRSRRRRPEKLVISFVILIVAFGLGSTMGISMGFNGDNGTNIVQNNTTHVPIDVTHNISAYENCSDDSLEMNASNNDEGVVEYSSQNYSDSYYDDGYEYNVNDVDSSEYY